MAWRGEGAEGTHRVTIAADLAQFASRLEADNLPVKTRETVHLLMLDVAGLCVAARNHDYVKAAGTCIASEGKATAIGHRGAFGPYDAALVNGTAAHGEDYDDTFEGGPVHAGAVIVPAVLAIAEHRSLLGADVQKGVAAGLELMCRMSLVTPEAIHKACFHPTAVLGAPAAAAAVATALSLSPEKIAHAIGIAGSLAAGIIEYLADGSWTKRLHAGSAAQSGIRAALLAEAGFTGPKTVLEGSHGFYKAFAPSKTPNFSPLLEGLGTRFVLETIAFKPYACGTMTQPFIDCAIELRRTGIKPDDIASMVCNVGEGTVHRLWEPLASEARAAQRLCRQILDALLHCRRVHRRQGWVRAVHRRTREGQGPARARCEGVLRDRSEGRVPAQFHRTYPGHAERRQRARSRGSRICAAARTSR